MLASDTEFLATLTPFDLRLDNCAAERDFLDSSPAIPPYLASFFASSLNHATKSRTSFLPSEFLDTTAK